MTSILRPPPQRDMVGKFTSKYRGVKKNKNGTWTARIWYKGAAVQLGTHKVELTAHQAVVAGSLKYYGEFSPYYMKVKYDETGEVPLADDRG